MKKFLTILICFSLIGMNLIPLQALAATKISSLSKGLVGQWLLDGASKAKDKTPYQNNGTAAGGITIGTATDQHGQANKATTFDGSDNYIDISGTYSFPTNEASINVWVKLVEATPSTVYNTGFLNFSTSGLATHYTGTEGYTYMTVFKSGRFAFLASSSVTRTNWHMVTITTTPGTNGWKFYQNGVLVYQDTGEGSIYSSAFKYIGRANSGYYFHGTMSDLRMYNRALSQTEITSLYQGY